MVNCALLISIAQWTMDIFDLKKCVQKNKQIAKIIFSKFNGKGGRHAI